jgi:hypothetical protein
LWLNREKKRWSVKKGNSVAAPAGYVEFPYREPRGNAMVGLVFPHLQMATPAEKVGASPESPDPEVGIQLSFYPQSVASTDSAFVPLTETPEQRSNQLPVDLIGMYFTG